MEHLVLESAKVRKTVDVSGNVADGLSNTGA